VYSHHRHLGVGRFPGLPDRRRHVWSAGRLNDVLIWSWRAIFASVSAEPSQVQERSVSAGLRYWSLAGPFHEFIIPDSSIGFNTIWLWAVIQAFVMKSKTLRWLMVWYKNIRYICNVTVLLSVIIGTARIVCGAASMYWYGVCPSIYLSQHGPTVLSFAAAGLLLWAQRAGDVDWLLQQRNYYYYYY